MYEKLRIIRAEAFQVELTPKKSHFYSTSGMPVSLYAGVNIVFYYIQKEFLLFWPKRILLKSFHSWTSFISRRRDMLNLLEEALRPSQGHIGDRVGLHNGRVLVS